MYKWFFFIWLGTKMMLLSSQIGAFSAQEFNKYLFGDVFGNVVNTLLLLVLFGVTSVIYQELGPRRATSFTKTTRYFHYSNCMPHYR